MINLSRDFVAQTKMMKAEKKSTRPTDSTNRLNLNRVLDEYILGVKIEAGFSWSERKADTSLDYLADRNIARDY